MPISLPPSLDTNNIPISTGTISRGYTPAYERSIDPDNFYIDTVYITAASSMSFQMFTTGDSAIRNMGWGPLLFDPIIPREEFSIKTEPFKPVSPGLNRKVR